GLLSRQLETGPIRSPLGKFLMGFSLSTSRPVIHQAARGHRIAWPCSLSGRFREIVVDEAQDCNPADLDVIEWLRASGVTVKVVCDPNQAIYSFRGGLTDQLLKFAESFDNADQ